MLYDAVKACDLQRILPSRAEYRPFPKAGEPAWAGLHPDAKAAVAKAAERALSDEPPALRASAYLEFAMNGNRSRYEYAYFARRARMMTLVFAECAANSESRVEAIADAIWAICEETTWVVPAHLGQWGGAGGLCDVQAPAYIDLFAAETGASLAWALYLIGDRIEGYSPVIARRAEYEIRRRIVDPYLAHDDYYWLGFSSDRPVNNWNPWINSNALDTILLIEPDEARRAEGVLRCARSAQRFLDGYQPDGGCDEGPSYFSVAGASLFDLLETLHRATGGAVDLYGEPLIRNIAKYIYRACVAGDYYVNFADAPPRVKPPAGLLRRVGAAIHDDALVRFAEAASARNPIGEPLFRRIFTLQRMIGDLLSYDTFPPAAYPLPREHYFEGIQVLVARKAEGSEEGLFVAFKGGHNAESHNHNDVGSYVLYANGAPIVVDAGVETYSKSTFDENRYRLWTMRSEYHNLPSINGEGQFAGEAARASRIAYSLGGDVTEIAADIAGAFPEAARVRSCVRTLRFDRASDSATVTDEFELSETREPVAHHLLCYERPISSRGGAVRLGSVDMRYPTEAADFVLEEIPLTDPKIRGDWGREALYRITLTEREARRSGSFEIAFALRPTDG